MTFQVHSLNKHTHGRTSRTQYNMIPSFSNCGAYIWTNNGNDKYEVTHFVIYNAISHNQPVFQILKPLVE